MIQKWGAVKNCCDDDETCTIWSGTRPDSVLVTLTGLADDYCIPARGPWCTYLNQTYEMDYYRSGPNIEPGGECYDLYKLGDHWALFSRTDSAWEVGVHIATACSLASTAVLASCSEGSILSTSETYSPIPTFTGGTVGPPPLSACDFSSATISVDT